MCGGNHHLKWLSSLKIFAFTCSAIKNVHNFDLFEFFVDGSDEAHKLKDPTVSPAPAGRFGPRGINLNPMGSGNNYISFPMLADIGFKTDANQTACFSNIQVKNLRYPSNTIFSENLSAGKSIFKNIKRMLGPGLFSWSRSQIKKNLTF